MELSEERQAMIDYIIDNKNLEASYEEIKTAVGKVETSSDHTCIICQSLPINPVCCKQCIKIFCH